MRVLLGAMRSRLLAGSAGAGAGSRRLARGPRAFVEPRRTASRSRRSSAARGACCTRGWPTPTRARCCCRTSCRASSADPRRSTSTGPTTPGRTTTPTWSPRPGSRTGPLFEGRMREMLRNEIRYTNAKDGIPADLDLETGEARAAEPVRGRRVRQGRPARHHRAARPHALVLPDGRHDRRPDEARARRERLRPAARRRRGAQRRRAAEPGPARRNDRGLRATSSGRAGSATPTCARSCRSNHGLPGYTWDFVKHEGPDRMRLRDHGNEIVVGLAAAARARERAGRGTRRVLPRSRSPACSTASWPRPTPTGCSTTRSAPPTWRRCRSGSPTTGATSTAPSTPTTW